MAVNTSEIWQEFADALRRFILRRVRDEDAADDILQDVFVKIHKNIDKLKDEKRLQAWLYQITRNTIFDYYRSRKLTVELPEMPEQFADEIGVNSEIGRELSPCVKALMKRLPDRYRQPLMLTEFEGLSQKEMGEKLGLSFSGAKSRVQRGKGKLKDLLLECCHFEFDRLGNIQEYRPKSPDAPECCGSPDDSSCE